MALDIPYLDKDALRLQVPLAYIAGRLGIDLRSGKARCPWHQDRNPSFHIYVDWRGVEKFACAPCDVQGDVYDLVQRVHGLTFPESVNYVQELYSEMPDHAVEMKQGGGLAFDRAAAIRLTTEAAARTRGADGFVCVTLGLADEAAPAAYRAQLDAWLAFSWGVGLLEDGTTVYPHWDSLGVLQGVKYRDIGGKRWSMPGSQFTSLYGVWRPRRSRDIVICEGETDALWASMQDPPLDVYALPAGAGKFMPHWVDIVADTCWLAFDADTAGDEATAQWQSALTDRDVRVVDIPRDQDLKSARIKL